MFGQLILASTATTAERCPAGAPARASASFRPTSAYSPALRPQTLTTVLALALASAGRSTSAQRVDPRVLEPDAVQHPASDRQQAGGWVAAPWLGRQRLHNDRAQSRKVEVGPQLSAVAGGPRGGHDRVR